MFETHQLIPFLLATITLNLTPGPDILYIATRAVTQGRAAGLVSALGVGTGCLGHTVLAALGLSAVIMLSSVAFTVVKIAGAGYLIWLGVQALRTKNHFETRGASQSDSKFVAFRQGALTNLLNPKVAVFFLSFLPQFIEPSHGSVALQALTLGLIFTLSGTLVSLVAAVLFGKMGTSLMRRPSFDRARRWISGSVFIGLGLRLAFVERR